MAKNASVIIFPAYTHSLRVELEIAGLYMLCEKLGYPN